MKLLKAERQHGAVSASGGHQTHTRLTSRRSLMGAGAIIAFSRHKPISSPPTVIAPAATQVQRLLTLDDQQGFTKGPFTAYMIPYNKGALHSGLDFAEWFTLDPATFPAGSVISWDWPAAPAGARIRGFLAIDYGNYYNTVPEAPIPSSQVRDIKVLKCNLDFSIMGIRSGFNVIINFFLTRSVDSNSILFEIEVFLHTPRYAKSYIDGAPSLGKFTSASGIVWKVCKDPLAAHGPDILFYPLDQADELVGTVDLKEMLSWIRSRRVITGNEFFNGLAVGIEPQQRSGTTTVNALTVDYSR